jgi:hypothetical protein
LVYSVFDEKSYARETWIAHKSSVFVTSGYCWFYAGLQIVVGFFNHKYHTLQWGNTDLYFPSSLTLWTYSDVLEVIRFVYYPVGYNEK